MQPVPLTLSCKSPGQGVIWMFYISNATEDDVVECFVHVFFCQGAPGLSKGNSKAVTEIAQFLSSWTSLLDIWSCDGVPFPSLIPKPTNAKDWNELYTNCQDFHNLPIGQALSTTLLVIDPFKSTYHNQTNWRPSKKCSANVILFKGYF